MKMILMALLTLSAVNSFAQDTKGMLGVEGLHDVVVPTVWGTPAAGDLIQGMIYFDGTSGALKFIGNSATPVTIGVSSGSSVSTSGSSERIERANISNSGTPTVTSQSGTWIASLTDNAPGDTTINFAPGTFSGTPTCVCNGWDPSAANEGCGVNTNTTPSSSSYRIKTFDTSSGATSDRNFSIICMGPR